jgi:hypothetical protein
MKNKIEKYLALGLFTFLLFLGSILLLILEQLIDIIL